MNTAGAARVGNAASSINTRSAVPATRATGRVTRAVAVALFFTGLAICCYPYVARWVNNQSTSRLVQAFENVRPGGNLAAAEDAQTSGQSGDSADSTKRGDMFASIEIPKLNLKLPIYVGGSVNANLSKGIAHLQGSSLPVGGVGTHAVLAGHNGAVTNEWFTHIDRLTMGDEFFITVGEKRLAYRVIFMKVIAPTNTADLQIVKDQDLVTLLTCAESGKKRLIVTGERELP